MGLGFWVSGLGLGSRVYEFRFLGLGYLGFREFQGLEFWGLSTGQCGLGFWAVWFGVQGFVLRGPLIGVFAIRDCQNPSKTLTLCFEGPCCKGPRDLFFSSLEA